MLIQARLPLVIPRPAVPAPASPPDALIEPLLSPSLDTLPMADLLSLVLSTTVESTASPRQLADQILTDWGGLRGLARLSLADLLALTPLAPAQASRLAATVELARRIEGDAGPEPIVISEPMDVVRLVGLRMSLLDHEQLWVVLLTSRNPVCRIVSLYQGQVDGVVIRTAEVFREAVRHNCPALVLVHGHPSGDPTPSEADLATTRVLVQAGRLLGITIHDHIIIGAGRHISLRRERLGFEQSSA